MEACETKFVKEIAFERFRNNSTFEEAEEIEHDLDTIRRWCMRIVECDWFVAPRRAEAEAWIDRCQGLLDAFEHDVYERDSRAHTVQGTPTALHDHPHALDVSDESPRLPGQQTSSAHSTVTDKSAPAP